MNHATFKSWSDFYDKKEFRAKSVPIFNPWDKYKKEKECKNAVYRLL